MSNLQALLPFLLIAVLIVPMVLMGRRQKKAMQQQQELQNSLHVGDRVTTTSGLYGTVTDASGDATIELEIAPGVETTWLRAAVREKVGPDVDDSSDDDDVSDELSDVVEDTADDADDKSAAERTATAEVAQPVEHGKQAR